MGGGTAYSLGRPDETLVLGDTPQGRGRGLPFVELGDVDVVSVTRRYNGYCALFGAGGVKCWGPGHASMGLGDTEARGDQLEEMGHALPYVDLGEGVVAVGIAGSFRHVCAWTQRGQVKCWGLNDRGQLGLPVGDPVGDEPGEMGDALPFVDLGEGFEVVQVSVGENHTCALSREGQVKCWGANSTIHPPEHPDPPTTPDTVVDFGRLGTGDKEDRVAPLGDLLEPVDLGDEGGPVVAIASSTHHNCALFDNGRLKCWGEGGGGRIGYEDREDRGDEPGEMGNNLPFVDLGDRRVVTFSCLSGKTCALLDDDTVRCWGTADAGYQPGSEPGTMGDNLLPVATSEELGGG